MESTSAGHNQEHRRGGSDIGSPRRRAEACVQRGEAGGNASVLDAPVEHALGVGQDDIEVGARMNEPGSAASASATSSRAIRVLPGAEPRPPMAR